MKYLNHYIRNRKKFLNVTNDVIKLYELPLLKLDEKIIEDQILGFIVDIDDADNLINTLNKYYPNSINKRKDVILYSTETMLSEAFNTEEVLKFYYKVFGDVFQKKLDGFNTSTISSIIYNTNDKRQKKVFYTIMSHITPKVFLNYGGRMVDMLTNYGDLKTHELFLNNEYFIAAIDNYGLYDILDRSIKREKIIDILLSNPDFVYRIDYKFLDTLFYFTINYDKIIDVYISSDTFKKDVDYDIFYLLILKSKNPWKIVKAINDNNKVSEFMKDFPLDYYMNHSINPSEIREIHNYFN